MAAGICHNSNFLLSTNAIMWMGLLIDPSCTFRNDVSKIHTYRPTGAEHEEVRRRCILGFEESEAWDRCLPRGAKGTNLTSEIIFFFQYFSFFVASLCEEFTLPKISGSPDPVITPLSTS